MQTQSPLDAIKPEVLKRSAYTLEHVDAPVKLDQNESPYEFPETLKKEAVDRFLQRPWARYPEFVPASITRALSKLTEWPGEGILVGNGSNELITATLVVSLGIGRTVAIPQPTFTLYRHFSTILQANVAAVPLHAADYSYDIDALADAAKASEVVVICSPNNPTGGVIGLADLRRVLDRARGLVIVDEAYHEFSGESVAGLLREYRRLVVLRTFSKALSMAALRFGYLMADPALAREIHKAKLPYNVNAFTLIAAELALENRSAMDAPIARTVAERNRVMTELRKRAGVECFDSRANFILFKTPHPARRIYEGLRAEGVLIRDVSGYPMLDRALRVSIGLPEENSRFLAALDKTLNALKTP
jgi:histidinol-phosphate aminotransferase